MTNIKKIYHKYLPKEIRSGIRNVIGSPKMILNKFDYYHKDQFTFPYIIPLEIEGTEILYWIAAQDTKTYFHINNMKTWPEMKFIRDNILHKKSRVIEIGSHHGLTALLMSSWVGETGHIYALEPGKNNYRYLINNINLNHKLNITPINAAVGDSNAEIWFADGSMGSSVKKSVDNEAIQTAQITIDKYFATIECDLIKIDVQGFVEQTLAGMDGYVKKYNPNIACEIDTLEMITDAGGDLDRVFNLLSLENYCYFVQFDANEEPQAIVFDDIKPAWEKRNQYSRDLHLYMINKGRL